MNHRFRCQCGTLVGEVAEPHKAIRAVCYCRDCQAYAHFLGKAGVLDELGGTDVIATQAKYVTITGGKQSLACASLTEKGLLRWYARCCRTPIANTPRDWRLPYVGLVHTCLDADGQSLDVDFTKVQMRVNLRSAKGTPPPAPPGKLAALLRFVPPMLLARVSGAYKRTPFFDNNGSPVVPPQVLTSDERQRAMSAV
ncbi:MAG TPA: DUF6151 family protein [Burkholderiaceae bacterium]|nr:DUF6151 family protein [Burkholderiaceae bacterium]